MSREHELFEELRKARRSLAGAKGAEKEARAVFLDRKAARLRAEALVEKILSEVETGKTGRPVLDAIAAAAGGNEQAAEADPQRLGNLPDTEAWDRVRGAIYGGGSVCAADRYNSPKARGYGKPPDEEDPDTADERQRGPTGVPSSVSFGAKDFAALPAMAEKLKAAAKGRPKAERADRREVVIGSDGAVPPPAEIVIDATAMVERHFASTSSADLDAALQAACYPIAWRGDNSPWPALKEHGCDDAKILEVLRAVWPVGDRHQIRSGPDKFGHTTQGGAVPKFWLGARLGKDQRPLLSGLQLAIRVRIVLDLPNVKDQQPEQTAADSQPVRQQRGKAVRK